MLQWQHHFANATLARGREYFRSGRVKELEKIDSTYFAQVYGSYKYSVIITLRGSTVSNMECSCPYAEGGENCKHMAAVLYAIQAENGPMVRPASAMAAEKKAAAEKRKKVMPFYQPAAGEYRYFDLSRILSEYAVYDDTLQKAQRLLASGIDRFNPHTGYLNTETGRGMVCTASVKFPSLKGDALFSAAVDHSEVVRCSCGQINCKAYYYGFIRRDDGKAELCEHMTALFLLMDEYLKKNDDGDATDYDAMRMFRTFRGRARQNLRSLAAESEDKAEEAGKNIRLEPRLSLTDSGLALSFRTGYDKLYVVRNMTELVNAAENGEKLELGKLCTLDFSKDAYRDNDRNYYRLMRGLVRDEQFRQEYKDYREGGTVRSEMLLFGSSLDRLYEIAAGTRIPFANKRKQGPRGDSILLEAGEPEITFYVEEDVDRNGVFQGVRLSGDFPEFFDGVQHKYFFGSDSLLRVSADKLSWLDEIAELFNRREELCIGRNMLTEFYHNVLPELKKHADVVERGRETVDIYLPPEVSFRFYLDAEEGVPRCRAVAAYGETECSLTEWLLPGYRPERMRDSLREQAVLETVQQYFSQVDPKTDEFTAPEGDDAMYRVVTEGVDELREYGEVLCTNRFNALNIRRHVPIKVGVSVESDLMNLQISSELSDRELIELLQSYRQKKKYHRLKSGEFIAVDDSVAELSALMEELHVSLKDFVAGHTEVPAYRALYLDKMLEETEELKANRDRTYRNLIKGFKTVSESDFEAPEELAEILRPYQLFGYKWLRTLSAAGFCGILADDMGLGKTLQVIALLLAEKQEGSDGTSLVVCPASLVYNWNAELTRFAPELRVGIAAGSKAERKELLTHAARYDVLLTSYDLLKRDCAEYDGRLFQYLILDEAQFIKNHSTGAAKSVKVLKSRHRIALTGTPIENRLSELWSIFDFLMPGFLYGYEEFRSELELPITRKKDEEASARLRRMVSPFILRRLKEDVLRDLPPKLEEVHYVHMEEEQQKLYDAQVAHMKASLEEKSDAEFNTGKIQLLAELTRIRQICCDPGLIFEDYAGGSAKREACIELIRSAMDGGHRLLVFSQFTSLLALLEKDLTAEGIEYYKITGATPKKERVDLVSRFNEGSTPVFLISLKAGGTGLNLTGADVVVHYDPWWNLAAQNQATDRAHRIGQTKVVTVYQLLAENSVEENIRKLQETKKDLADEILTGEGTSFSSLSREELLDLLR